MQIAMSYYQSVKIQAMIEVLTMPVAKYHAMIVIGSAMIYLTRLVKFNSKAKLPKNPQARDIALRIISL